MAKYLPFLFAGFVLCHAQTCYYPNGLEAEGDSPCDPDNEHSACCGQSLGSACLSNKLCRAPNGNVVRGSCTDRNWESPDCPQYCLGAETGGTDLISCSNVTNTDTSYCCNHSEFCCDTGVGRFQVEPSRPDVWAAWNRAKEEYVVVGSMYDGASTTTTSSSPTSVATGRPTDNVSGREGGGGDGGLSVGVQLGIGFGAGVGVVLLATLIFFLWRRNRATHEPEWQPPLHHDPRQMIESDSWNPHVKGNIPEYAVELQGHQARSPVELSGGGR